MALQIADRVKETTASTGTGNLSLAGAMVGFRTFSSVCSDQDTCWYALQTVDGSGNPTTGGWEVGIGTYNSSGNTLSRTTVLASSNSNALVSLPSGTTQVWIGLPAAKAVDSTNDAITNRPTAGAFTLTQSANLSGAATIANLASGRGFVITVPQASANNDCVAHAMQSVPGGSSWSITAQLAFNTETSGSYSEAGIVVSDASSKNTFFGWSFAGGSKGDSLVNENWSTLTTFSGRVTLGGGLPAGLPAWMRLTYSGGNFTFYTSADGETWVQRYQISATSYIGTPATCGLRCDANNRATAVGSEACTLTCFHYVQG